MSIVYPLFAIPRCTSYISILEVILELPYDNWQDIKNLTSPTLEDGIVSTVYPTSSALLSSQRTFQENVITKCASEIFFSLVAASAASLHDIVDKYIITATYISNNNCLV